MSKKEEVEPISINLVTLITEITFAFCINKDSDQVHKKSPACISRINDDELYVA